MLVEKDPDLNFIDQNFFSPSSSAANSDAESKITALNTLNQIYEERASRNAEVSASPIITSYLNTIVESDTEYSKPYNIEENEPKKTEEKNNDVPYLINEVLQLDSGIVFPLSGF